MGGWFPAGGRGLGRGSGQVPGGPAFDLAAAAVVEGGGHPQIGECLFVSPRTVQTDVAHLFTKLAVSSRAQLAAEAARRRQAAPRPEGG